VSSAKSLLKYTTLRCQYREDAVDLAGHVALQAAHYLAFGQPLPGASLDVGPGSLVGAHSAHDDHVEGGVGLAIPAAIETVASRLAARGGQWAISAQHREARFGAQPVGILARGDQQLARTGGSHAFELEQIAREFLDERSDEAVEFGDLVVEVQDSAGEGLWQPPPGLGTIRASLSPS